MKNCELIIHHWSSAAADCPLWLAIYNDAHNDLDVFLTILLHL